MEKSISKSKMIATAIGAVAILLVTAVLIVILSNSVPKIMKELSLQDKISQMLMLSFRYWDDEPQPDGEKTAFTVINNDIRGILDEYHLGVIIYSAQNLPQPQPVYQLTADIPRASIDGGGISLIICTDQEGGHVFGLKEGTALPGNMALGVANDPKYAFMAGKIIASELNAIGINASLAPVVDVNNNANNPVIGLRSFSDDPSLVGRLASNVINGMKEYGVINCAKHFPGHGVLMLILTMGCQA